MLNNLRIRQIIFVMIVCIILTVVFFPVTVKADMGPKASVHITFENMGDALCYSTLLSEKTSTGPYSAWDGDEDHIYNYSLDLEIWEAFAAYEDADGYYFLQTGWKVSETKAIDWTYYPPASFKILLYYPESGSFIVSDIYERYAFDSYYTVDMDGVEIASVKDDSHNGATGSDAGIYAYRSYDYRDEIVSLLARIFITILIEMAIALLFGFRKKNQLLLLVIVNTATQIILSVLLNVINYKSGEWAFAVYYVLLELIVFAIEAIVYSTFMNRWTDRPKKKWFYVVYALVANGISFGVGMMVAQTLPGIF